MFWRRKRAVDDFAEEVRSHLQLEADDLEAEGRTATDAQKRFGNVTAAQERFYERGRILWFHDLVQDLRYGLRAMRRDPGFTLAAVLTLALGMGANTAIFSLIDAVLLRSLPVKDSGALYFLNNAGARAIGGSPPYPCFERFRAQSKSFAGIAAYANGDFGIRIDGRMEQVDGSRVSGAYHDLLGVMPLAGRLLTADDEKLDPPVAVIGYAYWQRRFGGTLDAIGKTFTLDEHRFTIVGITPKNFHGLAPGRDDAVTIPITIAGPKVLGDPGAWWFSSIGRLKQGVRPEQAQAEIDGIFQTFMNESHIFPPPEVRRDYFHNMVLSPASRGMDKLRRQFSRPLWALMAVVGLVLLIACANITNLLLARAAKREREFAVRVAIGAGQARLFRQLLVEIGLLFVTGAVAGLAIAWWGAQGLVSFFTNGSRPILLDVRWDLRVAAFTAAVSLLATLIFGAAPILRALRAGATRNTPARGRFETGRLMATAQIALSIILLTGAALFLRTLRNLYTIEAGFSADQVGLMLIHLPDPLYHEAVTRIVTWDKLLAEVRRMPSVRSASFSVLTPLDGFYRGINLETPGFQPRSEEDKSIGLNTVSENYFATMGTAVLRGRDFTANDHAGAATVAMLNETAARHFFPGRDPVGAIVNGRWQIIGVVADAREADLRKQASRFLYVSMRQPLEQNAFMTLSVRTTGDPRRVLSEVLKQVRGVGSEIQIVRTNTLARQRDESLLQERLISSLASAFGFLGLLLSAVGLYGVLAYSVARRTSEIGIRMALGALPGQVMWSILRQTLWLVAVGLAAGIPAAIFLAKLVANLFYGVTPTDAATQLGAAALLALVAFAASYFPARRAGRVDPLVALRYE